MGFRLVPQSVTLNDLERRNNGFKAVTMRYFTEFGTRQCSPKNVVFSDMLLIAIFAEVTENECVMHMWSHTSRCHYYITYSLYFQIQLQV